MCLVCCFFGSVHQKDYAQLHIKTCYNSRCSSLGERQTESEGPWFDPGRQQCIQLVGQWSSGMILALGTRSLGSIPVWPLVPDHGL